MIRYEQSRSTVTGPRLGIVVCDTPLVYSRPRVGAVIALKRLAQAKTRLSAPAALRQQIALSMFLDTAAAIAAVADETVVISAQPGLQTILNRMDVDARVLADDRPSGLNPALRLGESSLRTAGADRILACVGDLPSLTPAAVRMVLAAVDRSADPQDAPRGLHQRCFVPDAAGIGTTMLIADRAALEPRFQGTSGRAHQDSGAVPLEPPTGTGPAGLADWARARRDVDTEDDLQAAYQLGVGRSTRSLIDPVTGNAGAFETVTVIEQTDGGWASAVPSGAAESEDEQICYAVLTESGLRLSLAQAALQDRSDRLRTGQRLHVLIGSGRVLTAWS